MSAAGTGTPPGAAPRAGEGGSTQGQLLAWGRQRLAGIEGSDPGLEARWLLEWALDVDSLWSAPRTVGAHAAERFRSGVALRRARVPLQHVTGRMSFRGLDLLARPGVFVVRPETEVVAGLAVEATAALPARAGRPALVVDLCTGSGAIGLAVAAEVPGARVHAVDIDARALALARENVARLVASGRVAPGSVTIHEGDATTALPSLEGRVDVVVSNPPYVPGSEVPTQPEALADPEAALYGGGEDGLVIPRGIVHRAARLLGTGGALVLEHAPTQARALREAALAEGFSRVATVADLAGRDRALVARRA